ncbi:MAG: phospholipase D family protein, partial [Paraburkholderia tropica]
SPKLASQIEHAFVAQIPQLAYETRLAPDGSIYWIRRDGDSTIRYDVEPNSRWSTRLAVWFFSILPIEWLL